MASLRLARNAALHRSIVAQAFWLCETATS